MPVPTNLPRPLTDMLRELGTALRAGDRSHATQLEQSIPQPLAIEATDHPGLFLKPASF
jgi:hypothetical protein